MRCSGFRILEKRRLAHDVYHVVVSAPHVTMRASAGQFVIVRVDEKGERIPLTLMDFSREEGCVDIVFQVVGTTTDKLSRKEKGSFISDIVGPLGKPTEVERFGRVVCVGGGVGIAALYPIARSMVEAGNDVRLLLGARDAEHLILLERMKELGVPLKLSTDDGSLGVKGFVTDLLEEEMEASAIDRVIAVGPILMMKAVSEKTRSRSIPTVVSLNAIMLDGTGMCGTCRCEVGGKTMFSCVDGPEFDGHQVDFNNLISRLGAYRKEEALSWELFRSERGEKPDLGVSPVGVD